METKEIGLEGCDVFTLRLINAYHCVEIGDVHGFTAALFHCNSHALRMKGLEGGIKNEPPRIGMDNQE